MVVVWLGRVFLGSVFEEVIIYWDFVGFLCWSYLLKFLVFKRWGWGDLVVVFFFLLFRVSGFCIIGRRFRNSYSC